MASLYWVGGSATWDTTAATKWAATSGGVGGQSVPTSSDDVYFDSNSGVVSVTHDYGKVCNNLSFVGFTGTFTLASNGLITVYGNADFGSTMTLLKGNAAASIAFRATSPKNINWGTHSHGALVFDGVGGSWVFQSALIGGNAITLTNGSIITNDYNVTALSFASSNSNARSVTLGSAEITLTGSSAWSTAITTNLTVTANTATVTFPSGTLTANIGAMNWNGLSFKVTGSGVATLTMGATTVGNFTRIGTAVKTDGLLLGGNLTVTGMLTLAGNSALNRLMVGSTVAGTARTLNAGTIVASNVDLQDISGGTGNWDLSAITGLSGDMGGNFNITCTPAATQTSIGSAAFAWSTHSWSGRVPLPQDDVVISNAFVSGRNITVDQPRLGRSIDFSGLTWTGTAPGLTFAVASCAMYGSLSLKAGMTIASLSYTLTLAGRTNAFILSNGVTSGINITINTLPSVTVSLSDALMLNSAMGLAINSGTFRSNGYALTCGLLSQASSTSSITYFGNSLVTLTGTGTVWGLGILSVFNCETSTIDVANTTTTLKTFQGQAKNHNVVRFSGDNIVITGNNRYSSFQVNTAGRATGLKVTSGTTQTVDSFSTNGASGSLAKISASVAGFVFGLSSASSIPIIVDYMSIQDCSVAGTTTWYAGLNSINVSGNYGWLWTGGTTIVHLSGSMTANSTFSGDLTKKLALSSTLTAGSSLTGDLIKQLTLNGALKMTSAVSGRLVKRLLLAGSIDGVGILVAHLAGGIVIIPTNICWLELIDANTRHGLINGDIRFDSVDARVREL